MPAAPRKKLRFAIMCRGPRLQRWMAECVRHLVDSGLAEPVLLIRDVAPERPYAFSPSTWLYDFYDLGWVRRRCPSTQEVDLSRELGGLPSLDCRVRTEGKWSQYFQASDIAAIEAHELDFILRFAFNIIRGDILTAARYGVWSYHHDDERKYRGGPPCFWEIYHGDDTNGAILQRLTERLDGGVVLHRGVFGTRKGSWRMNFDQALAGSADWCARVCAELSDGQLEGVNAAPTASEAPIRRAPNHAQFLGFAARCVQSVAHKAWLLLLHQDTWNVGIVDAPLAEIARAGRIERPVTWFAPHARDHFIADPFPCELDGVTELLVEDYDQHAKGKLSRVAPPFSPDSLELQPGIERTEHLSYPCVFVDGGRTFCVPEAYQTGRAVLYERVGGAWREVHTLFSGEKVVDPTLFHHEGRYYLFYTRQDDGAFGNLKLYARYADELFGEWRAHLLNPLKCDVTSSRPAGQVFTLDGKTYRPAQDCSRTYGGALVLHEILELSPTRFREIRAARLTPDPSGPYPDGLHTLNALGDRTVIDGKRFVFDPLAWRYSWRRARELFM